MRCVDNVLEVFLNSNFKYCMMYKIKLIDFLYFKISKYKLKIYLK